MSWSKSSMLWLEEKVIGLVQICCSWSFIFWIFWQNFPCFFVSAFTISLSYKNMFILNQNSQSTFRYLIPNFHRQLNFRKFNKWVRFNKQGVNSSINKQVFCLYTLDSFLRKLEVIAQNQGSSVLPLFWLIHVLSFISFNNYSLMMTFINQNIGRTEINLVKPNNLYFS